MKISFTGDIIFSGKFTNQETNTACIDDTIIEFLSDSDSCVCDIEGPIFSGQSRTDKVAHRNTSSIVAFTSQISGDVWYVGNNHILDYGVEGLKETMDAAKENNIRTFGAGMNLQEASAPIFYDKLCGIIGVRYYNKHGCASASEEGCFIWDEDELIKARIKEIKHQCKWCIVVSHAGDEFCDMPMPDIRERYLNYLEWGADIIVGHHPHVVQNYENVGDKVIFYSIGNFLFGTDFESIHSDANTGILIKIDIQEDGYSWSYLPVLNEQKIGRVVTTVTPAIFRNIDIDTYSRLAPVAAKEYINQAEMKNIKYNLKRKDIAFLGKMRIVLSHVKKNIRMRKKYKSLLKKADPKKTLAQLLAQ